MTNVYSDYANKTRSSKLLLCHVEAKQRLSVFTLDSGTIYKKSVDYFVVNVDEDGTALTEASSAVLNTGEFYYDAVNGELYVNTTDDTDPKTHNMVITYRLFFSNMPIDLPYDLSSGVDVHYEGRLTRNSPINKQLDDEQIGIVLETNSSFSFENRDGYFDDFFDTLIFENNNVSLYSWSEILPLSEKKKLFSGIIKNKTFSESSVSLSCKDSVYSLRKPLSSENFTTSDGDVPERYLYKPKRKIFGQHEQLRCTPVDSILDGYTLTGTASGSSGSAIITGSGTSFLDECSPEDDIFYDDGNQVYRFGIASVDTDTQLTLTEALEINISGTITNNPKLPWRKKNRNWHIAGHKLRAPSTTISYATSSRRFNLTDETDFLDGDLISIAGTNVFIGTISGDFVTLSAAFPSGIPTIGASVTKNPLRRAFLDGREVFIDRDWSVSNTATDCILQLDALSEFNIAQAVDISLTVDFTASSRSITINGADYTSQLSPRDWIRSDDITHTTWYEVLSVTYDDATGDTTVLIRTAYAGSTLSTNAQKKNVDVIDDQSIITVNCVGMENTSGEWIKTASDAVKELISTDAALSNINTTAFSEADTDAPYILSYKTPEQIGGSNRPIKDVISDINTSVLGSLIIDGDQNFKYSVLLPKKPTDLLTLKDDDIVAVSSITSKNEVIRKVNAEYRHFSDKYTGDDSNLLYEFTNDFVDKLIGSTRELTLKLYLYNLADVKVIAQRYAFYNSLSQSTISIKGKLNLALYELNDKINLNLDRIPKRFGNRDRQKIGIINKISKDGKNVTVEINDLGNSFSRVASIAANTSSDFSSASDSEKLINGYIVDNDTLTPDNSNDNNMYQNLIS